MNFKKLSKLTAFLILSLYASIYAGTTIADDDVAALVVDNGTGISIPEPSTLVLLIAGTIGAGVVAYRKRKDK